MLGLNRVTIDTYINTQSSEAPRGSAANKMAAGKNRRAHKIIEDKGLDIDFKAITFSTFGGFGEGTHEAYPSSSRRPPTTPTRTSMTHGSNLVPSPTRT